MSHAVDRHTSELIVSSVLVNGFVCSKASQNLENNELCESIFMMVQKSFTIPFLLSSFSIHTIPRSLKKSILSRLQHPDPIFDTS